MRRVVSRLMVRAGVAVAAVATLAVLGAWQLLRASLPQLDGEVRVGGIGGRVLIERDAGGLPTLGAATREDLAFATGFVHGQDRFFQMDLSRRNAAGELADLFGARALPLDRRRRLHRFRERAEALVAALDTADTELLAVYARGVNAALRATAGRPFEYVVLRAQPEPWRMADSLLVAYSMFLQLDDERADGDLRRGYAARVLPDAVFAWLYPHGTPWDAPVAGTPGAVPALPEAAVFDLRTTPAGERGPVADPKRLPAGSNSWAVSGALSRSGRAIVANDMHLPLAAPNVFYRARLMVDGEIDVSGVTLPGVPVVIAGSNGHIAWGLTNSYGDWSDAVLLEAGSEPGTYRTPDGERRYTEHRQRIEVRAAESVEFVVRETVWGPVREDLDYPDGAVAVRWIAHSPEAVNLALRSLETARSVEAALDIAARVGIPPQNFVVGDADGNIGWTIAGRIPKRPAGARRVPVDWRRQPGWTGWLAPDEYPRIVNPPGGRLWTANARVVDGPALALIGDGGYDLGARAAQIRDSLATTRPFRAADMLRIQLDDRALFLQRWRDLLLSLLDRDTVAGHPRRADVRRQVADWQPRAAVSSVGYRLVRAFRSEVRRAAFAMLVAPVRAAYDEPVTLRIGSQFEGPLWALVTERPPHLLAADYADWRGFLLQALDRVIANLAARHGKDLAARDWGERNTAAIRHPLSAGLPLFARWLDMPRDPLPGDHNMPRVQSPGFGASERFAVSPGAEREGYLHMPAGQSGHPLSPFYRRGHEQWVEGAPTPFLPGPPLHRLQLVPLQRDGSGASGLYARQRARILFLQRTQNTDSR